MDTTLITTILSVTGAMVLAIGTILGWLGSRVMDKLDELDKKMDSFELSMVTRLASMDTRMTITELRVVK